MFQHRLLLVSRTCALVTTSVRLRTPGFEAKDTKNSTARNDISSPDSLLPVHGGLVIFGSSHRGVWRWRRPSGFKTPSWTIECRGWGYMEFILEVSSSDWDSGLRRVINVTEPIKLVRSSAPTRVPWIRKIDSSPAFSLKFQHYIRALPQPFFTAQNSSWFKLPHIDNALFLCASLSLASAIFCHCSHLI